MSGTMQRIFHGLSLEGGGTEAGKEREGVLGGKKHKANIWRLENACCVLGTVSLPFIQSNHPEFLGKEEATWGSESSFLW